MGHLHKYFGILCILLVTLFGCQKTPLYTPSMVASIDTLGFNAIGADHVYATATSTTDIGTTLTITGATSIFTPGTTTAPVIDLSIPCVIGTYTINTDCSAIVYVAATGPVGTKATAGQIIVTNIDNNRIEGTFSFNCAGGQKVTKGQFYCSLPTKN